MYIITLLKGINICLFIIGLKKLQIIREIRASLFDVYFFINLILINYNDNKSQTGHQINISNFISFK